MGEMTFYCKRIDHTAMWGSYLHDDTNIYQETVKIKASLKSHVLIVPRANKRIGRRGNQLPVPLYCVVAGDALILR